MTAFDELHCDPPAAALSSRLRAAGLDATRADLWRLGVYTDPQGVLRHQAGTTTVTLAWWPDHRGAVWVRVWASEGASDQNLPPLSHVGRERVFRVAHGEGVGRWLTACPCGEVGTPESTLWMGYRCGACHDRREEGSPSVAARASRVDAGQRLLGVDFLPNGSLVAVGHDAVSVIYPRTNAVRKVADGVRFPRPGHTFPEAVSGDGRFVVVPDLGRRFRIVGIEDGSDRICLLDGGGWRYGFSAAFQPGGSRLVATNGGRVFAFDPCVGGEWSRVESSVPEMVNAVAFDAAGRKLVAASLSFDILIYDPATLEIRERSDGDAWAEATIASGAEGRRLASALGRFAVFDRGPQRWNARAPVAFAPDGRHAAKCRDGVVEIRDVSDPRRSATISPVAADAVRLAFSPDASTLAVASAGGEVVLIPWRELLEAAR